MNADEIGRRAIAEAEANAKRVSAQAQSIGQVSARAGECAAGCRKAHPDIRSRAYKVCVANCELARSQRMAHVNSPAADTDGGDE